MAESQDKFVYTDTVVALTDSGDKKTQRFVCTVRVRDDNTLDAKVKFLG